MPPNSKEVQQRLQQQVEDMKALASLNRQPVSASIQSMVEYCNQHAQEDAFLNPPRAENNPFREKSRCAIL